jgi:archaellum component FlaC
MSSNAALSAARRRRSNPAPSGPTSTTNMQLHNPPVNRIIQRTGVPPPVQQQSSQQFNPRMMQPQTQGQARGPPPPPMQSKGRQPLQPRPQSPGLPPLPPPVKTAGPLYGIPIHPLVMFKTHDNKLSEHELSIGDCLEQLKEIDERLTAVESSNGNGSTEVATDGGDLNDLINDDAFINGVVDNIMNTTNFASIVDNIIPLKDENDTLKQQVSGLNEQVSGLNEQVSGLNEQVSGLNEQVSGLNKQLEEWKERMQQIEDQVHSICFGASAAEHVSSEIVITEAVPSHEKCINSESQESEDHEEEEE